MITICHRCKNRKLFRGPIWRCEKTKRLVRDYVTGKFEARYKLCSVKNCSGACPDFEPEPTFWEWLRRKTM